MSFNFYMPVKILSGKNAVRNNKDIFLSFGKKCGIVTGKSSAKKCGALDDVISCLGELGISYCIFDEIGENPLIEDCHRAGRFFDEERVDFLLGIGGGSVLDASKAIGIYTANASLSPEDIYLRKYDNSPLDVLLIGTTSGTGSEVSSVSVLTNGRTNRKKSISGSDCYAKVVFADSTYTCSMPYAVTVSTALDALAHAIEGYFCPKCTIIPGMFADVAITDLWKSLKWLHKNKTVPDEKMRETLYYASLHAGMVLNPCGTLFPHPLGYVLTENYGIPHGKACAAFMTELMERGFAHEKEKAEHILALTGATKEEFCSVIESLTDLPEITMTAEEIEEICSRWDSVIPGNFLNSPGGFTKEDAKKIFTERFA
ncbi:MAG: iron-containing alcohol dehydrogenase [Clostridia bacterium]|nr:iron-containing alcohol dehydrogenase [Clostridia bacterium]